MKIRNLKWLVGAAAIVLAGCGGVGDGDGEGNPPQGGADPTTLTGTAAAGAPIIGQVTVKGALGNARSATIEADGSYEVDVSGLTAPYRLRATGTVGGKTYKLHSYAEAADVGGVVNITPFTDLIVANAAQQVAEAYFDSSSAVALDPAELEAQEGALQSKLQNVFDALGVSAAIDLLNSSFSADHSGLDAALDIISIEVDTATNVATITNLIENTSVADNLLDGDDNTETLAVNDSAALSAAVSDNQAIANLFSSFSAAFAAGLPTANQLSPLLAADFLHFDESKDLFLTEITTDPSLVGLAFSSPAITELDSTLGTAQVTFQVIFDGVADPEVETWFVARDASLGWQLRGNQQVVDMDSVSFHCNDFDATDSIPGGCGINVSFFDEDFSNTGGNPVASATMQVFGADDLVTPKATVFLGTPAESAPGEGQIYNVGSPGFYTGDFRAFGTGLNEIDPTVFEQGDIVRYNLYTQALDLSDPNDPAVAVGQEVASYTSTVLFAPSLTGLYPSATAATVSAIQNYSLGENLTIAWTLAAGTVSDEVLVMFSDDQGNRFEVWDESFGSGQLSTSFAGTELSASSLTSAGLDPAASSYELRVRIYAVDELTGQAHSVDYSAEISTSSSSGGDPGTVPGTLSCGYESGWNDTLDEPASFNSYNDFLQVQAACGSSDKQVLASGDVVGSWVETYSDADGDWVDTLTFAGDGTGQFQATLNGVIDETIGFTWSINDGMIDLRAGSLLRVLISASASLGLIAYEEDAGWRSSPDLDTLDGTAEGEIWYPAWVRQ